MPRFYKRHAKFCGMDVPDGRKLREHEGANATLKRLLPEAYLEKHSVKSGRGVKR